MANRSSIPDPQSAGLRVFCGWLVHLYTALGAVIAFLTILFIDQEKFREAFLLMFLAVIIDATDGTLARSARVKELIPWFDGDRLEAIVDYANYVMVPSLFLFRADLLPRPDAHWLAALPLVASAYGFCHREAKTADHFFLGFPSYWNVLAFYLYLFKTPPWINGFSIIVLSLCVFFPIQFIYPTRSPHLKRVTILLGVAWGTLLLWIIYRLPEAVFGLALVSLFFPAYYTALSLRLEVKRLTS